MFSSTTTELSTIIPMEMLSPASDMMFRLTPKRYMAAKVATKESGMEMLTIPELAADPRKSISTAASSTASSAHSSTQGATTVRLMAEVSAVRTLTVGGVRTGAFPLRQEMASRSSITTPSLLFIGCDPFPYYLHCGLYEAGVQLPVGQPYGEPPAVLPP